MLLDHDATGLAELVRSGQVAARELVEESIAAIEAGEATLNALVHRQFDRARAEAGAPLHGPFAGVPFVLKDFRGHDAGEPYCQGMAVLRDAGYVAPATSPLTGAFRRAGLVVVGRSNTPEMALMGTTEPTAFGPTHNPWLPGHSPGGSSGGSAAAVAAGYVAAGHANDIAGSIRIPAAHCGLVGLKPTTGAVTASHLPDRRTGMQTEGVLTRSVRDTAGLLDAILAVPMRLTAALTAAPSHLRMALWTDAFNGAEVEPSCVEAARRVAEVLEGFHHHIDVAAPAALSSPELAALMSTILAANNAAEFDEVGELLGRTLNEGEVEPNTWRNVQAGRAVSGVDLIRAFGRVRQIAADVGEWFRHVDVLITPSTAEGPTAHGGYVGNYQPGRGSAFTRVFNATGNPAISLPLGWADDGAPRGVQLVAAHGRDDLLIAVAAQLELAMPWAHRRPPSFNGS